MATGNEEVIFDCIIQEANRQRIKHPEQIDLINAAEKKTRSLVKDGKLEENLMLVEFTRKHPETLEPKLKPSKGLCLLGPGVNASSALLVT